jgi:alpha-N-arabinofuranosidase
MIITKKVKIILSCLMLCIHFTCIYGQKTAKQMTQISIEIPNVSASIDPMIYGQMLEDCNDKVIYGGLLNEKNEENPTVFKILKQLQIPVVRWPAGTYIHEYDWENGIGPKEKRPSISCVCWGGYDSNLFGTDEFLQWCQKIGTEAYINFNMSNHPEYAGSLGDALNWMEYVNGSADTPFGMKRVANGHAEPYHVKYWCIGNENYGSYGVNKAETAEFYSNKLNQWASIIKSLYPEVSLLSVGYVYDWNKTILEKNGNLIDFIAAHYYMGAKIKDDVIQEPYYTLFSPLKAEMQIKKNIPLFNDINKRFGREDNPVRFSVDEWNCRHSIYNNGKYAFTRNDDRRIFDVITIAGMLNVFIRQCQYVGMANYIFPVNGHGLIRTVGEEDAYRSTIYYVFDFYRKYMTGKKMDVNIEGQTVTVPIKKLAIQGNIDENLADELTIPYIDGTSVMTEDGMINIALINRSHEMNHKVKLTLPKDYVPVRMWSIEDKDVNAANKADDRMHVVPKMTDLSKKQSNLITSIPPCGFILLQYERKSERFKYQCISASCASNRSSRGFFGSCLKGAKIASRDSFLFKKYQNELFDLPDMKFRKLAIFNNSAALNC